MYNDNHLVFSTVQYYCAVDAKFRSSRVIILDGQIVPYLRNPNEFEAIEQRGNMFVRNEYTPETGAPIPVGQYADIDFYDAINQFNSGNKTAAVNAPIKQRGGYHGSYRRGAVYRRRAVTA